MRLWRSWESNLSADSSSCSVMRAAHRAPTRDEASERAAHSASLSLAHGLPAPHYAQRHGGNGVGPAAAGVCCGERKRMMQKQSPETHTAFTRTCLPATAATAATATAAAGTGFAGAHYHPAIRARKACDSTGGVHDVLARTQEVGVRRCGVVMRCVRTPALSDTARLESQPRAGVRTLGLFLWCPRALSL